MPRPVILGVCGDSAAGKTTITQGLVELLGKEDVTHIAGDDYHRYDRKQRAERGITPLNPECNYMDIMESHFGLLKEGKAILKPVYIHDDGTFGPPEYVSPHQFCVIEGLLGYHTEVMRSVYDVRVFLAPPEELRRKWKVDRDCSKRGYTTDEVLEELDRREPDSAAFIRPQEHHSDMVVAFQPPDEDTDDGHLDARVVLRTGLNHPDLSAFTDGKDIEVAEEKEDGQYTLIVSGSTSPEHVAEIEEAIWNELHFASHLRTEHLGEFTFGKKDVEKSASLALVQLLILYQLLTARASVALGAEGSRADHVNA